MTFHSKHSFLSESVGLSEFQPLERSATFTKEVDCLLVNHSYPRPLISDYCEQNYDALFSKNVWAAKKQNEEDSMSDLEHGMSALEFARWQHRARKNKSGDEPVASTPVRRVSDEGPLTTSPARRSSDEGPKKGGTSSIRRLSDEKQATVSPARRLSIDLVPSNGVNKMASDMRNHVVPHAKMAASWSEKRHSGETAMLDANVLTESRSNGCVYLGNSQSSLAPPRDRLASRRASDGDRVKMLHQNPVKETKTRKISATGGIVPSRIDGSSRKGSLNGGPVVARQGEDGSDAGFRERSMTDGESLARMRVLARLNSKYNSSRDSIDQGVSSANTCRNLPRKLKPLSPHHPRISP